MSDMHFEERFQRATQHIRNENALLLKDVELDQHSRTESRKTRRNLFLGGAAVILASGVTALGLGHSTLGEGVRSLFPDDSAIPTSPIENERANINNAKDTGEPLITDQR